MELHIKIDVRGRAREAAALPARAAPELQLAPTSKLSVQGVIG
jgi:hypothetical protein